MESDKRGSTTWPLAIGRYQVTDRLGQGGMGTVYLARDPSLERFVAIKVMRQGFENPDLRERFVREARAVASLRHPCIVTLFEYGDHDNQPFIVMEYIAGKTLAEIFAAAPPMSLERRLQLAEDLCRGLYHAHKAGIVHRDVKPANIMVDAEGTLKILDFGIAKLGQPGLTKLNALVGTPKYMSPEQVLGRPVTRRSDIFSVGLVFYELLAHRPAFDGEGQFGVMDAIANGTPAPLSEIVPGLDPRIIRIVDKALEKDADRRYQDLAQMRRDIERLRLELAVADRTAGSVARMAPPQDAQLEELGRRRAQQIAANLENADRAFELGDYQAALAASEDALILDPHNAKAREGLQRAQAAINERQALDHLSAARQYLEKNELDSAENQLDAAFGLAPTLREGLDLRRLLEAAREQVEQRLRDVSLARERARIRFDEGAFESAVRAADQVLAFEPADADAQRVKANALAALEEAQRQRELDRRVQLGVDEARRLRALDRFDEARTVLQDPDIAAHPMVVHALALVEKERAEFQRLAAAREAERVAREQAELQRLAAVREAERAAKEQAELQRLAAVREAERVAKEQAGLQRLAAAREAERVAREQAELQRLAAAREAERAAKEQAELQRLAAVREAERVARERAELQRLAAAREAERVAKEQAELQHLAAAREAERVAKEQAELQRLAAAREAERVAKEQAELQRLAAVREAERMAKEATPAVLPSGDWNRTTVVADAPATTVAAGGRWMLFPPDMVVEHRTPMRRKPKPVRRPFVERPIAERPGERAWIGDNVFVQRKAEYDSAGFGVSIGMHVVLGAAILLFIFARPVTPPAVKNISASFVELVPPKMAVEAPQSPPTSKRPPTPPKVVTQSVQALPAPPPPSEPLVPGLTLQEPQATPLEAPQGLPGLDLPPRPISVPVGPPVVGGGRGPVTAISEDPVDDFDEEPQFLTRVKPKIPVGASGMVRVEVLILTTGKVSRVRVLDDTPYKAAIYEAASLCTFRPARRRGRPVAILTEITFELGTNK